MVERQSLGRETVRIAEGNVRILGKTTFKEMEIESPKDNLNLASDKITLAVLGNARLAFSHHPFSGEHTVQLLDSIAPFGSGGRAGILEDLRMPVMARRAIRLGSKNSENAYLHRRHLQDPEVGPLYQSFIDQHLDAWIKNLKNNASWDVFYKLQRVRFVTNIQNYISCLFAEWKEILSEGEEASKVFYHTMTALDDYKDGKRFVSFLGTKVNLPNRESFHLLPLEQRRELINTFLEQLTEEEKKEFGIAHVINREELMLVDVNSKQVWHGKYSVGSAKLDFVDEECIEIKDDEGTVVGVVPNKDVGRGSFDWKAINYTFSPKYLSTALYPTIAWEKNENGERRFLSQSEVKPYLRQLGFPEAKRGDVNLGEIEALYFSKDVTKDWEKRMPLKPLRENDGNFKQRMMGAQMPVWVRVAHHSAQLLSDDNPFFRKLEERMNATV